MPEQDDTSAVDALPPARRRRVGGARWVHWPAALVLVWAALAVADVAVFHSSLSSRPAAARPAAASGVAAHGHARASSSTRPTPARTRAPRPLRVLAPVSVTAIGPAGPGSGDNPQAASMAIDASTTTAWVSNWYRTPEFGGLQAGTGLLVDMGRTVRATRVQITLGSARGADLQVLTGNVPALTQQRLQASASDAGGTVRLTLARPERARYLVVWFTLLPPDSSGTFQVSVYGIKIFGRPPPAARRNPAAGPGP